MKNTCLLITFALCCQLSAAQTMDKDEQGMEITASLQLRQDKDAVQEAMEGWWKESMLNHAERMSWYNDAKFGCFIHWGVYSVPAGTWKGRAYRGYSEHLMRQAKIPLEEYRAELVEPFNPTGFDAWEWMEYAHMAGMKYFIVTAKHHDGFAMYHSDVWSYDMRLTQFDRDPMAELRDAARRHGIKFGFYYSHAFDWEHPDAPGNDWDYDNPGGDKLLYGKDWWMENPAFLENARKYVDEKSIPQILELIEKYDPDILWFDTPHKLPLYENIRILKAIRKADPEGKIVVNGRLARFAGINFGDYINTGDRASYFPPVDGPWESIPTTNESYGYSVTDTIRKPTAYFIRLLTAAAAKGGNILMNVGPMGNGQWDPADVDIFKGVGEWLAVNGEAVYGSEKTDLPVQPWGVTTRNNGKLYLHVFDWPADGILTVGGLTSDTGGAYLLSDAAKKPLDIRRNGEYDTVIKLSGTATDTSNSVVVVDIASEKPAYPVRLLEPAKENRLMVFDAGLSGRGLSYGDGKYIAGQDLKRYYITGWKNDQQAICWEFRLTQPAAFDIYLDYNTATGDDRGMVVLELDGRRFESSYVPVTENNGSVLLQMGSVELAPGEYSAVLEGSSFSGSQYMRPLEIKLVPAE